MLPVLTWGCLDEMIPTALCGKNSTFVTSVHGNMEGLADTVGCYIFVTLCKNHSTMKHLSFEEYLEVMCQ